MEFSAVNRRRPSRETPLGPGAKKDGCFRRLFVLLYNKSLNDCHWFIIGTVNFVSLESQCFPKLCLEKHGNSWETDSLFHELGVDY